MEEASQEGRNQAEFLALIRRARREYHAALLGSILYGSRKGMRSGADEDCSVRIDISIGLLSILKQEAGFAGVEAPVVRLSNERAERKFVHSTSEFLMATFLRFENLPSGRWQVIRGESARSVAKYAELFDFDEASFTDPISSVNLNNRALMQPDVAVIRTSKMSELELSKLLVNVPYSMFRRIREGIKPETTLHASVTCLRTIHNQRELGHRAEALHLIRKGKGKAPYLLVVTGETSPERLAGLLLGSQHFDNVYHIALPELRAVVQENQPNSVAERLLNMMVAGRRLRDIADLPVDLIA